MTGSSPQNHKPLAEISGTAREQPARLTDTLYRRGEWLQAIRPGP
jgi:hypothetical protein